ncbi:family 43 glycosylhydrolase [Lederbergia galactosidilytica]|uniref:Glycosyl hydrolase family 32 N-terminal domain-containing protein n=1 Tax=Lederbergia galactosidilytica TaxID=217031 RepID=A0A178A614_9BACI|nr:family 43 glycosylhydrolase [Lederbergia galactosidilytica]OAK75484.1 hypothetical protein ABB05_01900 [Lederbergia galactosidilytica]
MSFNLAKVGCQAGWEKYEHNPILGDESAFVFDMDVVRVDGRYRMYFSWRNHYSIAMVESEDGFQWGEPRIVLEPNPDSGWEDDVNRPAVVYKDGLYHMWYSGQTSGKFKDETWTDVYLEAAQAEAGTSYIGYATSKDGIGWERREQPVLKPTATWELQSLMCPSVLWDQEEAVFKMWYSGGGWFEPNAIGYATSQNGIDWEKPSTNPIFTNQVENLWERERVAGCHVFQQDGWYYMAYIGFEDLFKSRVCLARSRDGVTNWERHPNNPIISAGVPGAWDSESIYKPYLLYDQQQDRWLMWFNARSGTIERIGVAIHEGKDLGF